MKNKINRIIVSIQKYLPILVIELFLTLILLLFLYGDLNYIIDNKNQVVVYLLICNLAIALGYILIINKYKVTTEPVFINIEEKFLKYFWFLLLLGSILLVFRINVTIKIDSVATYIKALITGLVDPTQQYSKQYFTIPSDVKLKVLFYIAIDGIFSAITFSIIPLAIMFKERISRLKHIGVYLYMLFIVSFEICKGSNSGNYILAIIVLLSLLYKMLKNISKIKLAWFIRHIDTIICIILLVTFCVGFFRFTLGERTGGSLTNTFSAGDSIAVAVTNNDNPNDINTENKNMEDKNVESKNTENKNTENKNTESITPKKGDNTLSDKELQIAFTYYSTSSLRNLSAALNESWVPTYGFGHSQVLSSILENIFGVNLFQYTYTNRLRNEGKINVFTVAPTYADIASDVTFPGSIVIMFIIGGLIAYFWKKFIFGDSTLGYLIMILWALFIITLPGLNLILNQYYYYFVFVSYIMIFIIKDIIKYFKKRGI